MSAFEEWFVAQHGPRPSKSALHTLFDKAAEMRRAADRAFQLWQDTQEWEARHTSALYAWHAREKDQP